MGRAMHVNGLDERVDLARSSMESCSLCPRECRIDRTRGRTGECGIGALARVASYGPHFGEETVLVGPPGRRGGSGTIFFSGCNLHCAFCQNYDISHGPVGPELEAEELARIMLNLQRSGCLNINLVTPSHVVPQILEAVGIAVDEGLRLPIVYNSGGYDSVDTLRLLDGVVDIYMPDFKFWYGEGSAWLPGIDDYAERATAAIREMYRQVGDLVVTDGCAVSGLLVRHLVMPRNASNSREIFAFLASLSRDTYVNVMDQYRPCGRVGRDPVIGTSPIREEYLEAVRWAKAAGLHRFAR